MNTPPELSSTHLPLRPILLVEDNPMDVDLTRRAFAKRNILNPLEVARDGAEALEYLTRWDQGAPTPVVILLDLNLPKVSGLEVLRQIKAHERWRVIPIVMLTTSSEHSDIREAYQYNVNSYIVKPVSFEKFIEVAAQIELYWGVLNHAPVSH